MPLFSSPRPTRGGARATGGGVLATSWRGRSSPLRKWRPASVYPLRQGGEDRRRQRLLQREQGPCPPLAGNFHEVVQQDRRGQRDDRGRDDAAARAPALLYAKPNDLVSQHDVNEIERIGYQSEKDHRRRRAPIAMLGCRN